MGTMTTAEMERRYDAARNGSLYFRQQADEPTMYDTIGAILESCERMPSGDQIYELLLSDRVVSYAWWRAIDWILYRQSQGLPVGRMNTADENPAAIDARFRAARVFEERLFTSGAAAMSERDIHELCNWNTIERWERVPA